MTRLNTLLVEVFEYLSNVLGHFERVRQFDRLKVRLATTNLVLSSALTCTIGARSDPQSRCACVSTDRINVSLHIGQLRVQSLVLQWFDDFGRLAQQTPGIRELQQIAI